MKKLGLFIYNFFAFYAVVQIVLVGLSLAVIAAGSFTMWKIPAPDTLWLLGTFGLRITIVASIMLTISWIFTDGRREWDW